MTSRLLKSFMTALPFFLAAILILAWSADAFAQGSAADYQRAASFDHRTRDCVFRSDVSPNWINGGPSFWYKIKTAPSAWEFVLCEVDAEGGERRPAFDHERLADTLSTVSGREIVASNLPLNELTFSPDLGSIRFKAFGNKWTCDLTQYAVSNSQDEEENTESENSEIGDGDSSIGESLPCLEVAHASRRRAEETSILFINQKSIPIRIYWLDESGDRQHYKTLAPGGEHAQHTYGGHIWLVTDSGGRALAAYEASNTESRAVVHDASTRPRFAPSDEENERRPRGPSQSSSPDGVWQAFLESHNVFIREISTGDTHQLSENGIDGNAYQGRFYWSPDSKRLVVMQRRDGERREIVMVESSPRDQIQPKLHTMRYDKPGDEIDVARPRLFDIEAKTAVPISEELMPTPWSISDLQWKADSSGFTFLFNQRGHQVLRVIEVNATSGAVRPIIDEQSPTFIDYSGKRFLRRLEATNELIWMSERDGWNHLYLIDSESGSVKSRITTGQWVVRKVERVDEQNRQVWFSAGGIRPEQDPYYLHLCRVNFDGTGLTVLTEGDGTHDWTFSPDDEHILDNYSRVDMPTVTEMRRTSDGSLVCELERADWSALIATGWIPPERFVAKGRDGVTDIHGIIVRPTNFDPTKTYPVIEYIYAGPHSAFVPKSFNRMSSLYKMAELGFILVQMDGMGTSHRSKAFHDVCWQNIGDSGFPDRILWMQAAAATYPHMDIERVGIYGGSAGGQSALRALLAHGDFYDAAACDCGCHDNRVDKIWWNEQWMGWPIGPHYEEQSNVTQAHRLQGDLFLIVGELDRNVDPASTMQVVDALIRADKDFDLLVVPGAGHGAGGSAYGRRRQADFFVRSLLDVEPRWEP
jgi:dipeptidyl-peptidase 4